MAQHTPGPWLVFPGDAVGVYARDGKTLVGRRSIEADRLDNETVPDRDEANANLRLIAAAPELLKQLKGLLGFANFVIGELDIDTESTEVILRANGEAVAKVPLSVVLNNSKAAIAAAEGRS